MNGWGVRPWNWEFSAGVQHEIAAAGVGRRSAISAASTATSTYSTTRRSVPATSREFSVVAAVNRSAPARNAGQTIGGFFDPNAIVAPRNVIKDASQFGKQLAHWNGFDLNIDARLPGGLHRAGRRQHRQDHDRQLRHHRRRARGAAGAGGRRAGRHSAAGDGCNDRQRVDAEAGTCHQETPFLAQYKGLASYTLPYGIRLSGTFQSIPGPQIAANNIYVGTVPSLGRPFTLGQANINLVQPGTLYGDRLNQFDLRFTKIISVGRGRVDLNVDLYITRSTRTRFSSRTTRSAPPGRGRSRSFSRGS